MADAPERALLIIPKNTCRDFEKASRLEWLDTNHTGAFAMGTVAGVNTRRYHSLLIASLHPPADRVSILPRVEEIIQIQDQKFELATVQYPGAVQPRGFELLNEFRIDPFPTWRYQAGKIELEKRICLLDHQQSILSYYIASASCRLSIRLFLSFRDYHAVTSRNTNLRQEAQEEPGRICFAPYPELPPLAVLHNAERFDADGIWYLCQEYLRELDRGLDFREDLYSPGSLVFEMHAGQPVWFIATLESARFAHPLFSADIEDILVNEARRREVARPSRVEATLCRALDQFRVTRADGRPSLVAGYPWFTDWSRDTLISLPAVSLAGFPDTETREILHALVAQRMQGLLPNRFADQSSRPEYNTADAALWFFVAAYQHIGRTKDTAFLQEKLYPAAREILDWHFRGTSYNIAVDPNDRLLSAGAAGVQLTWMDAKIGDYVVTPRAGKPVEINALWYNALQIAAHWAGMLGHFEDREQFADEALDMRHSFEKAFWNPNRDCLYDVLTPSGPDAAIRCNQLFAIALPFPLLGRERARSIVNIAHELLLTRAGLRTLEAADPDYQARYEGDMRSRDRAYHQGTVWPWLIGPFISAYLYAYEETSQSLRFCRRLAAQLEPELCTCCQGSLTEVYDAEEPQRPGGCPAQLWSVAQFFMVAHRLGMFTNTPAEL